MRVGDEEWERDVEKGGEENGRGGIGVYQREEG